MEDGENVQADFVERLQSGSAVEVVRGLEEDEEEMRESHEEDDADVIPSSDAEGQLFCLEGMYDSLSDSESTFGYCRFV